MLSARKVVSQGGETGWADMRAAYDALDADMRERVSGLAAYHSLFHSRARVEQGGQSMVNGLAELRGTYGTTTAQPAGWPPVTHPMKPMTGVHRSAPS